MTTRAAGQALTRERILHSARDLYLSQPYDQVTIRDIARAGGVSVPTVLLHFGSKDRLLEELVAISGPLEDARRETTPGDPGEAARVIARRYEETGAAVLRMLALEQRFPALARAMDEGRKRHRGWVERTFSAALAARPAGAARQRLTAELVAAYDIYTWHVLRAALSADETAIAIAEIAAGLIGTDNTSKGADHAGSSGDVGRRRHDSAGADDRAQTRRPRSRRSRPRRSDD